MPLLERWREHWLITVFLLIGLGLRICDSIAYHPTLLFSDSFNYLKHADPLRVELLRPIGYSIFLWPFVHSGAPLWLVPIAHHVLGLGLGLLIYAFCRRRSLPAWGAALAALPVLVDPLQLVLEEYILSDLLFEVLLATGFIVLLWNRKPGWLAVISSGLLVAFAGLVRDAGVPMLVVLLATAIGLRVGVRKVAAVAVAFAIPVLGYAAVYDHSMHSFALEADGPHFFYARIEPFVDCRGVSLTPAERQLCPSEPVGRRPDSDSTMFAFRTSRQWNLTLPPGTNPDDVITSFNKKVIRKHPWGLVRSTAADVARDFAVDRRHTYPGFLASTWLFHPYYWPLHRFFVAHALNPHKVPHTSVDKPAARFLTDWGRVVWTPGPLLALGALLCLLTTLGMGRSRWSGMRSAVGGLAGAALMDVLVTAALSGPSWRYQLPQLALLPPATALAITALWRPAAEPPARRIHPLDRYADRTHLGVLTLGAGICVGAGLVVAAAGVVSGWAAVPLAASLGGSTAAVTAACLVRSYPDRARRPLYQ